ncbi:MIP/aquaporin family protein [Mycoplasmopsis bovirhinis]|uniref:Aquaglyceroporin n=1 Tax=Mycoplasmopsis bovirhinis TaxID=29553 RepID=A0A449AFC1_9BACT|nr:MIP/aquaporin family protein [Mycoplasmopsis bovirhinis]VEU63662.1 Aquaglyceroporin [Mycoplasmopsis bovirhinis]
MLYLSEFIGTMILIIFGNGVVYSVSAKRMFANQPGKWVVIALAWGLAVLVAATVAIAMGGPAHLNPAVTIFSLLAGKFKNYHELAFIPLQILGAMAGQIILNFINWKHIQETDLSSVRAAHCTGPAYDNVKENAVIFNFAYELVGTLLLVGVILALGSTHFALISWAQGPLPVALLVMVIGMSLGSSTGYAINPARDLGPRIVYFLMERTLFGPRQKEHVGANWSYSWVPVLAPMLGGAIIGAIALAV